MMIDVILIESIIYQHTLLISLKFETEHVSETTAVSHIV